MDYTQWDNPNDASPDVPEDEFEEEWPAGPNEEPFESDEYDDSLRFDEMQADGERQYRRSMMGGDGEAPASNEGFEEPFDEFNDWDATQCAEGDYNAWEEEQVFQDHEGDY